MDVLQFFSRSRQLPPGRGAGERTSRAYNLPLNFRQILSNFYLVPIESEGKQYASVEHAFHARKLLRFGRPEASRFAVGAANYVGDKGGDVKRAGGRNGVYRMTPAQIAEWNGVSRAVLLELWAEKFGRNPALRAVLKETGDAELWHDMGRGKRERWVGLEELRSRL